MSTVKFSVVIPTRERAETLRFALRTCLDQSFDDYEIIVSDNCSSPATRAVVEEAGSPKVRYVRTPEPVAMSNSWEFAVSHAVGEYVVLIGDDDGLLPHALAELDRIACETRTKAIRWEPAFYTWSNVALAGQGDYLRLPLGCARTERDGHAVIREVVAFREFYTALPMLYNAAVHRDVLTDLRRLTGRVFPHPIPDVYSGFAVAHVAGRYISTTVPMGVSGQSGASNGIATLFHRGQNAIDREYHSLNARDGLQFEPTVPNLPVFPHVPVADSFAFAKRALFPDLAADLDRRELASACVAGARVVEADWPAALATIRESLADVPELQKWFDTGLAGTPYRAPSPVQMRPARLGFDGTYLHLDTAAFGVTDVSGAARLCEHLLNYRNQPVPYTGTADDRQAAAMKIAHLSNVCDDRERAILRLHLVSTELLQSTNELRQSQSELLQTVSCLRNECEAREKTIHRVDAHARTLGQLLQEERRWSLKRPFRVAKRLIRGGKLASK